MTLEQKRSYIRDSIPTTWNGHMRFAEWLVHRKQPRVIVELGVDYGFSTYSFALANIGDIYAIDWFIGDVHTGYRDTRKDVKKNLRELELNNVHLMALSFDVLPDKDRIYAEFKRGAEIIKKNNLRCSTHPDQFVVPASATKTVVEKSIIELKNHASIMDLFGLPQSYEAPINIHMNCYKGNAKDDDDSVYICFGMWVYGNGQFVNEDKSKKLSEEHPVGTIMYNGVVDEDGQLVFPSHGVSLGHVREFIKFLRHCGGFEIC